jgi:long-chain acyl-CoA synthetase
VNLARLAAESLERFGEHPVLAFEDRLLTNVDQERAANRLAHAFRRLGVDVGDRVAVRLPNCPEVIQTYAAILKADGVIVPIIFLLAPQEVVRILGHAESRVLVTSPDLRWKAAGRPGPVVLVGGDPGAPDSYATLVAREARGRGAPALASPDPLLD